MSAYEEHCRLAVCYAKFLWDNSLIEKYHKKLINAGIMVGDAPRQFDAFEYSYNYDEDIETILKSVLPGD